MKKPLLLFVLDYSTSMNSPFAGNQTRWEAAVDALVDTLAVDEGLLTDQLQIGVLRFGHDPDPGAPGTAIAGDASGLLDGQHLDLGFYDPLAPDKAYLQCNGDAVKDALVAIQSPLGGQQDGIESWTGGALARAQAYLQQTAADHPLDLDTRDAAIVLVTDGPWTDPSGTTPLAPATADPALVAADLLIICPFGHTCSRSARRPTRRGPTRSASPVAPAPRASASTRQACGTRSGRSSKISRPTCGCRGAARRWRARWSCSTPRRRCSTSTAAARPARWARPAGTRCATP
ncbi:hypothetical protein [Nannocystis pusilla]|uniref:hypothetical protein n=1 Tax=Nannocystis pusilla TaxID=889268 RepID=UPI003B800624